MKQLVMMTLSVVLVGVGIAHAQTPSTTASRGVAYGEVTFGPTFGNTSGGSGGAEAGYFLKFFGLGVVAEAGRISNVATSQTQDKAAKIAGAIGGTYQAKQPVKYFDAGFVKQFSTFHRATPYVLVGFGAATVSNNVSFSVAGADVTGKLSQLGVQLGGDLAGSYTTVFVTAGAGAHMPLWGRWFGDLSYRFGSVGKDTPSESHAISTNRLQFGVGTRF